MKKNKKLRTHYPKRNGSAYGMQPGLYLIDKLGNKVKLPLTNFSFETLTNRLTIGNAEFSIPEKHIDILINVINEVLNE